MKLTNLSSIRNLIENLDRPASILLSGNIIAVTLAILLKLDPAILVWSIWAESLFVGIFIFLKFALIINNDNAGSVKEKAGWTIAISFAIHYGIFHFSYFWIMKTISSYNAFDIGKLFEISQSQQVFFPIIATIFLLAHGYEFFENSWKKIMRGKDLSVELKDSFLGPYLRILPMHFAIALIIGVFLITKTTPVKNPELFLAIIILIKAASEMIIYLKKGKNRS